jgi:hypothetical protein
MNQSYDRVRAASRMNLTIAMVTTQAFAARH